MRSHESILPLALGAFFALAIHLAAAAGYVAMREAESATPAEQSSDTQSPLPPEEPKPTELPKPPEPPEPEIPIGQKEPSELSINWISAQAFEELLARQAPFDQAAVQADVEPVEVAEAPLDPTPPLPRPSPAPAVAAATAPPSPAIQKPRRVEVNPSTEPDDPRQAPPLPEVPAARAAAPAQSEPVPPTRIEAKGEQAPAPQIATDDTPAAKPVAAPKVDSAKSREVALATPQIASNPAQSPTLPEPASSEVKEMAQRRGPEVAPDERSDPDDRSLAVEAGDREPIRLAALPLPARVREIIGSISTSEPRMPEERETRDAAKPQDQEESPQPQPRERAEPTVPRPPAADTQPRPTAAIRDDREAPPVSREESLAVRPGSVLARQGLKVNTARPRWTVQSQLTLPDNPQVEVTFNRSGEVIGAKIVKSTGYANVDGPLMTSLIRWTAEGERLEAMADERLILRVQILLRDDIQ